MVSAGTTAASRLGRCGRTTGRSAECSVAQLSDVMSGCTELIRGAMAARGEGDAVDAARRGGESFEGKRVGDRKGLPATSASFASGGPSTEKGTYGQFALATAASASITSYGARRRAPAKGFAPIAAVDTLIRPDMCQRRMAVPAVEPAGNWLNRVGSRKLQSLWTEGNASAGGGQHGGVVDRRWETVRHESRRGS